MEAQLKQADWPPAQGRLMAPVGGWQGGSQVSWACPRQQGHGAPWRGSLCYPHASGGKPRGPAPSQQAFRGAQLCPLAAGAHVNVGVHRGQAVKLNGTAQPQSAECPVSPALLVLRWTLVCSSKC